MNRKRSRFSVEGPRDMLEKVATIQLQHESLRRFTSGTVRNYRRACGFIPRLFTWHIGGTQTRGEYASRLR
jgi:hypothetical protein